MRKAYPYEPPTPWLWSRSLGLSALSVLLFYLSWTNERGLEIAIFIFNRDEATSIYGVLASLTGILGISHARALVKRLSQGFRQEIVLTHDHLLFPGANEKIRVNYDQIRKVTIEEVPDGELTHLDGDFGRVSISSVVMQNQANYHKITYTILRAVPKEVLHRVERKTNDPYESGRRL